MNTHIAPARVHRVIGPRVVAGRWNAQVKQQPLPVVTRYPITVLTILAASAYWLAFVAYWLWRSSLFGLVFHR